MVAVGGPNSGNASGSVWLDTIPRGSQVTLSKTNFNIGETIRIYTNRKSSSFRTRIRLLFGTFEPLLVDSYTGDYFDFNTNDYADELYSQMKNVNSLNGTIRMAVQTSDGTQIGISTVDFIANVIDANPIFNDFDYIDNNEKTIKLTGDNKKIIKRYSNVKMTVSVDNKAISQKKSIMKKYRAVIGNKQVEADYSANEDVDIIINSADNKLLSLYAIDSRNNSTVIKKEIDNSKFIDYTDINIKSATVKRDKGGIGTGVVLEFNGEIFQGNFGIKENSILSCKYKFKEANILDEYIEGETDITPTLIGNNNYSNEISIKGDLGAQGFSNDKNFEIIITISDELSTYNFSLFLGSGKPLISYHKNGVAIGALYDENIGGLLQLEGARIIESGGNENGSYMKFSDGTLICYGNYREDSVEFPFGVANGLYRCSLRQFPDYAIPFVADNQYGGIKQFITIQNISNAEINFLARWGSSDGSTGSSLTNPRKIYNYKNFYLY